MEFTYRVVEENRYSFELGHYTTYGILVTCENGGETKERLVSDVSTDQAALQKLVDLCNEGQLDICHLDDVIEDFLNELHA